MNTFISIRNVELGIVFLIAGLSSVSNPVEDKMFEVFPLLLLIPLVTFAFIALCIWLVASRISGIVKTVFRGVATERNLKEVLEAQKRAANAAQADVLDVDVQTVVSMRCKSCGAVSRITEGEPQICAYCDSPLG
ncbi:MAG: hypothetical protein LBG68_00765 [Coriobacteriales bacterium]|jgi:hypothetical protein|nr:hypothetical protein [Coriobacteriales bacterium]